MDSSLLIGVAGRGGAAYLGWLLASRAKLPPVAGALVGWLLAGIVLDADRVLMEAVLPGKQA